MPLDLVSQRSVTVAILHPATTSDPDFVAAVREQVHRLAKPVCVHPALAGVYDLSTTDAGETFVVLETITGRSLREVLDERGVLPTHEALRLAIEIGEGLEALHANGIVHGELTRVGRHHQG